MKDKSSSRADAKSCFWGEVTPCSRNIWGPNWLETILAEKDVVVLMESKWSMRWERTLVKKESTSLQGCIEECCTG